MTWSKDWTPEEIEALDIVKLAAIVVDSIIEERFDEIPPGVCGRLRRHAAKWFRKEHKVKTRRPDWKWVRREAKWFQPPKVDGMAVWKREFREWNAVCVWCGESLITLPEDHRGSVKIPAEVEEHVMLCIANVVAGLQKPLSKRSLANRIAKFEGRNKTKKKET